MDADTIALLGECTAGIDLAVSTIDSVLPSVRDQVLRRRLQDSIRSHEDLREQSRTLLQQWGGAEKRPSAMAKNMTRIRAEARMALKRDDPTAAEVIADSCDLGIRSLCRSRNRYAGADHTAKYLTEQLIACEENLSASLRSFL